MLKRLIPTLFKLLSLVSAELAARLAYRLFIRPMRAHASLSAQASQRIDDILSQAQQRVVVSNPVKCVLYHWPAPSKQAKRVLINHGWTSSTEFMIEFVTALRAAGFDVYAMDFPAHGRAAGSTLLQPDAVLSIQQVRAEISPLFAQVGHSFGGAMSMMALRAASGQPADHCPERLVLISSPAHLRGVLERFAEMICLSDNATARFKLIVEKRFGLSLSHMHASTAGQLWKGCVTVIHDEQDREIPFSDAREIAQAFGNARLIATRGLGHRRILKSDHVTRQVVSALLADIDSPHSQVTQTMA